MRLNLGEIARLLCRMPEDVLWSGTDTDGGLRGRGWDSAPWAGLAATGAQVDSRLISPGTLFFCLPGEKADGHDFARAAAEAGAVAIVASRDPFAGYCSPGWIAPPVFLVKDVLRALWCLAMRHRDTSLARVIGITGTAGKTSVKEVLAQVLGARGRTECNPKNCNNQIGLPVSMLNASEDAAFWVMEAGISEARDMQELGAILRPDLALILNVGEGHVLGLGDRGVAAYKAMLLDYIQPGGIAVISDDYPDLVAEAVRRRSDLERKGIACVRFSASGRRTLFSARYEGEASRAHGVYEARSGELTFKVEAPFRGDFGAENVAAIVAVASCLGLAPAEMRCGFAQARLPEQRFTILEYPGCTLVDDSYNANPLSAMRMILAARRMADERKLGLILVMGEMLELGERAAGAHRELGVTMGHAAPAAVFWKGGHAAEVAEGLAEAGCRGGFYPVAGGQEFALLLEETNLDETLVLFKGSRGNKLERFVDIMKARQNAEGEGDAV